MTITPRLARPAGPLRLYRRACPRPRAFSHPPAAAASGLVCASHGCALRSKGRAQHCYMAARNHDPYRVDSDWAATCASGDAVYLLGAAAMTSA